MPSRSRSAPLREPHAYPATSPTSARAGPAPRRRPKRGRRRRRALRAVLLIAAALFVGAGLVGRGISTGTAAPVGAAAGSALDSALSPPTPIGSALPVPATPTSQPPVLALTGEYPRSGPGTWVYGAMRGPVLGSAGNVRRFRVAVETGLPEDIAEFSTRVDETLGDPRSWVGGGSLRLQRVPPNESAEFTIYLATPATAGSTCAAGGVDIRIGGVPYTSCRVGSRVIVNLSRWRESVPEFVKGEIPLEVYRQYVINHEVGHQLGYRHEPCPGAGRPAPVMQQQTLGLDGCTANAWPYIDGRRYVGPSG